MSQSYKSKFEALESKAHYKIIATKISKEMTDLRSKIENSSTTSRRWVWELIQNAKDVAFPEGVNIRISNLKLPTPQLTFEHDGRPFNADNIRFLIEQISSKEREKDEKGKQKNTGKFGTGFLTTHMLSEIVTVNGVAKEPELDYRQFEFQLDRSAYELNDIISAVEKAKEDIQDLDNFPIYDEYNKDDFNTTFTYPLNDDLSLDIAQKGLDDLENCLPFALCFVDEIQSVEHASKGLFYYKYDTVKKNENIHIIVIAVEDEHEKVEKLKIVKLSDGFTSIAIPIEIISDRILIKPISSNVPKLFCDFPLIGSEDFPFPTIINNPNFNPTDPRDGVYLTETDKRDNPLITENKSIIDDAVKLYFKLLEFAISENWGNLHLLANVTTFRNSPDWFSDKWHENNVLNPIRNRLLKAKIVQTANGELASILSSDNTPFIWFPFASTKEIREEIWQLANKWFPNRLPVKQHVELWNRLIWKECGKLTLDQFAFFVENKSKIEELQKKLINTNAVAWLNDFYKLLQLDDKEFHTIIDKRSIVPNQNDDFVKLSQLDKELGDINELFKDILKLLGNDIRRTIAKKNIKLDFKHEIDQSYIIREITIEVNEKANDRGIAKDYREAFNLLLIYFRDYPGTAEDQFPTIYKKKHLLYDDDEILNNIDKAEQLDKLLDEFNVTSAADLKELLSKNSSNENKFGELLPLTQEIILSMGITSIEEWTKALEDRDLKALFSHDSVPSHDMFVYAQSHIARAKKAVIDHLATLPDYDLSEMDDETAPTILAGIYKHGQQISIVVRPAYNFEVIIYYGSEKNILDYESSELWIEDPIEVRRISLGHILKTAQIRKFPV
ncbi:hypothetical protein ASG38_14870 [Flavobacterium sp. Leaf359]|uniref:sacsin N-terminal ATP-binding-like domain-containing protein n=1 Tax=Flavobacterium sp. Leaf359 TaxID=1736351 RepID=UPI0006FAB916|nr:hypothetical protein [Flavobacterium sp. Leaf359]KQS45893.1 hypothetical protein ASG38_14870 [Flavobacterium sp. Leaf359]